MHVTGCRYQSYLPVSFVKLKVYESIFIIRPWVFIGSNTEERVVSSLHIMPIKDLSPNQEIVFMSRFLA